MRLVQIIGIGFALVLPCVAAAQTLQPCSPPGGPFPRLQVAPATTNQQYRNFNHRRRVQLHSDGNYQCGQRNHG